MRPKIILATINAKKKLYSITANDFSAIAPNIQMGLLHAYLKSKSIPVEVIDSEMENLSFDEFINQVELEKPLLLGIVCSGANPSSSTMVMSGVVDFFKKYNERKPNRTKTFIWGAHPTVLSERSLDETDTDFIIRGEGYQCIEELYHCLVSNGNLDNVVSLSRKEGSNFIHNEFAPLVNVEKLPGIDWQAMHPSKYRAHNWHCFGDIDHRSPYAIIWTSFGCPYPCKFCCINSLYGKRTQRFRKIDSVIQEIETLVEKYGVKHIKILDELFVTRPSRVIEFCDKLIERNYDLNMWAYSRVDTINEVLLEKLKKAGMHWLSYGFETASTEALADTKKGTAKRDVNEIIKMTQAHDIAICADVMFGLENENMEDLQNTYNFLVHYNFEWGNMYPLFAYPGTDLYKSAKTPTSWKEYSLYGYDCKPLGTNHLTSKEVLQFRDEAFINYHSRPEYLNMIEKKYDLPTREHIEKMVKQPLKRKIIEETCE